MYGCHINSTVRPQCLASIGNVLCVTLCYVSCILHTAQQATCSDSSLSCSVFRHSRFVVTCWDKFCCRRVDCQWRHNVVMLHWFCNRLEAIFLFWQLPQLNSSCHRTHIYRVSQLLQLNSSCHSTHTYRVSQLPQLNSSCHRTHTYTPLLQGVTTTTAQQLLSQDTHTGCHNYHSSTAPVTGHTYRVSPPPTATADWTT